MVQSQSIEQFDTTVVPLMTADEARLCVTKINSFMNGARIELLRLYEGRGWEKLGYATWRECVTTEFGGSERRLYQLLEAAEIERNLAPVLQNFAKPIPDSQLRPLAALTPTEQPIAWQEANERSNGKPTAKVVEQVVKEMLDDDQEDELDPPMEPEEVADLFPEELTSTDKELIKTTTPTPRVNAGMFTSATPEWYTPRHIGDAVKKALGTISLDPCSNSKDCREAAIDAEDYYIKDDNGLVQPWHGRVYMNPPYGDEIGAWVERLVKAYESKEIDEAIALLPARTDTAWYQANLAKYSMCFIRGRLKFSGSENSAPFPSVAVYLGPDDTTFRQNFAAFGFIK